MNIRPDPDEAAEYYFTYINQVPDGEICATLHAQLPETVRLLEGISDEQSLHRYGPDKWSIREVVGHINDTERLFVFRAFWFARALEAPLPSFDQDVAASSARSDDRSWRSLLDEFSAVRTSTLAFFDHLSEEAWTRRGTASGNPFSVRALAWIAAGHVAHHAAILRSRYLARA